jgi:zinc protease
MSAIAILIGAAAAAVSGAGPASNAADTLTLDYTVGGVHVLQRITSANDIVAVDLYLVGGVQQLTAPTAGIELLALRAAQYGTTRYPGAAARHALTRTGSEWVVEPETDWTMVGFRGVADQFDSSWVAFADRIVHPSLDSAAVALTRERMIRETRLRGLTPEAVAWETADSLTFEGHPYALSPSGTEASLAQLTPDAVHRYVHDQFVTSRMLLVVVGNISRAQLEPLVASTLGTLPAGHYVWAPPSDVPRRPSSLVMVSRVVATNYIVGYYTGPSVASRDYPAFRLATELLGVRVSGAVRYRTSLSYAAGAPYQGRAISSGAFYASTAQPGLVVALMHQQLDSVRNDRLPGWMLKEFVKEFTLDHLLDQESNEAQAGALARAQLYFGDYRRADGELDVLRSVAPADLPRVAKQYMRDFHFVYVGDTTRVRRTWVNGW